MDDRKVFKFLSTLNKRQLNSFEDYVNSPYFNKSEELCFVYAISKKFVLSDTNKNYYDYFKKEFTKTKKAISQINLDKYLSRIYLLALDFVAQEKLKEKGFLKSSLLLEHLIDGDKLGMFDKVYAKAKTILKKEKLSYTNLRNKYLLEGLKAIYLSTNATKRKGKENLQELSDALDQFYLTLKYNIEIIKLSRQLVINEHYYYHLINTINEELEKENLPKNNLLRLQHQVYNIISDDEELTKKHLDAFCNHLVETKDQLEEHIAYNAGQFLRNQVRRMYNLQDATFYKYCFELNEKLLNNGLLHYKCNLIAPTFKNVVDDALSANELAWSKEFVNRYSQDITPKELRSHISNYANARIKFYSGNLSEARNFIKTLKFSDIYYKFALRRLEIMIYYELNENLYLDSLINSFRVALTPDRISQLRKDKKEKNKKFIYFISKLLKVQQISKANKKQYLEKLQGELNNDVIPDQLWFATKIREAIKQNTQ